MCYTPIDPTLNKAKRPESCSFRRTINVLINASNFSKICRKIHTLKMIARNKNFLNTSEKVLILI